MHYAIYLPQSVHEPVRDFCCRAFANHFGGWTCTQATGGWVNPATGDYHAEPVDVLHAYGPSKESSAGLLAELAAYVLRLSAESAVLYVIGWDGRLVERSGNAKVR